MKYLKIIWGFINSNVFKYILVAIMFMIILSQCNQSCNLKRDLNIEKQNVSAADSTINEYKKKDGEYEANKSIYISTIKDLKLRNRDLYEDVKKEKGNVISLNKAILSLKQDKKILHDSLMYLKSIAKDPVYQGNNKWTIPWELQYTWDANNKDIFIGHTDVKFDTVAYKLLHLKTLMDYRESTIALKFGEKVVGDKYNVYIESKYPGLTAESMSGVFLDPNKNKDIRRLIKKRHWFTGFSLNLGVSTGYNFWGSGPVLVFGPSLGYTIYQW